MPLPVTQLTRLGHARDALYKPMPNGRHGVALSLSLVPGSKLLPTAITLFGVGLLAIVAIFVLYASGERNLTVWLYIAAMMLPLGLALGIFSVVRSSRRTRRGTRPGS